MLAKRAAEGVPTDHERWICPGRYKAVGKAMEEEISGGGMAAEGGNKLPPTARRKRHREVVE